MVHLFFGYLSNLISNKPLDASDIFLVCLNKNGLHESVDFLVYLKYVFECKDVIFCLPPKNTLHEGGNFSCLHKKELV